MPRRRKEPSRDRDFLREAQEESNWSSFTLHFRKPGSLRPRSLKTKYSNRQLFTGALVVAIGLSGAVFIVTLALRLIGNLLGGSD